MKAFSSLRQTKVLAASVGLAYAMSSPVQAEGMIESATPAALTQAADNQLADYRQQQWARLAAKSDRDSLIAAVLLGAPYQLGTPDEFQRQPIAGHEKVEQRLAQAYGKDPLVAFTLALSCQISADCVDSTRYDALVQLAPENAMHWLLLPNKGAPDDEQLHAAATAALADTHLRDMFGIVRAALAGQPAPATVSGIDAGQLALLLRRDALDLVPLPYFGSVVRLCKTPTAAQRADCIDVGRHLDADRSGSILSRMVASALLRRLSKGTPEEVTAKSLRRDYVWMGEQLEASTKPYLEQLQADTVQLGEWAALQHRVKQLTGRDTAPAGWVPNNPQTVLLPEERTPSQPAK